MNLSFNITLRGWVRWLAAAACLTAPASRAASIVNSKHNLSFTGPGAIKSTTETQICIFCHTPHGGTSEAPLWNRYSSGAFYDLYESTTAKATIGQPTGASKLCLSCHDGTIALGMVRSRVTPIPFSGGVINMPLGRSNLGKDLADDHPISFHFDSALWSANGELHDPSSLIGPVRLDADGQMQCTTCHDPHDDQFGDFLVEDNAGLALCVRCHNKDYWQTSTHRLSQATWNGQSIDPWPNTEETSVAANACANCHTPHEAGTKERLLNFASEEQNCYSCHNGNVADTDIQSEFGKTSVHPIIDPIPVHDPLEDPVDPPRHVECVDCHNPHAVRSASASPPAASGALAGVLGIDSSGNPIEPLTEQYQLCYRCHADSVDRGQALIERQFPETNTRNEFDESGMSFHPVVAAGRNPDVPSLVEPYSTASRIYCTDCHGNNQGPGAGGSGPSGPHGSDFTPILERQLVLTDFTSQSSSTYALCYKCHSQNSIMEDESFEKHHKHVADNKTACTTCHDPHGVAGNTHLINFNLDYVAPYNGTIEFVDTGQFRGNCTLTCHTVEHDAWSYEP